MTASNRTFPARQPADRRCAVLATRACDASPSLHGAHHPRPRSVAFRHRRPPRFNRIGSTRDDSATVRAKFLSTHRRLLWMDVGCRSRVLRSLQPMSTNLLVSLLTAQVLAMSLSFTEAYPEAIIPLLQIALGAVVASAILLFCIDMTRIAHEWLRARKSRQYSRVRLR